MKDVTRTFIATAVIQLANVLSGVIVARVLLVEGRGELAAAMLWPGVIASLGILGIHEAVIFHASRKTAGANIILYSSLLLCAALSVVSAIAAFIAVKVALAGFNSDVVTAACYYLAFIPLNYFGLCMNGLFQGSMRLNEWNFLRVQVHVAYTALVGVFYLLGWATVMGVVTAALLSNLVAVLFAVFLLYRQGSLRPARPAFTRELLSFGGKVHLGAVVQSLADRLDQIFISIAIGSAGLGLYVVAMTLSRLAVVPATTFGLLIFTKVANSSDIAEQRAILGRYLRATLVLVLAVAAVIAVFGRRLLALLFGTSFAAAYGLLWILVLSAVLVGVKLVLGAGFKGMGRPLLAARAEVAALVFTALALALLLPLYGLTGAAAATVLAQAGSLVVMILDGRPLMGGSWRALLRPTARDGELVTDLVSVCRRVLGGNRT